MGSATALRYDHTKSPVPISGMIVDSSYCIFKEVAEELVKMMMPGMPPEAIMGMMWPQVCAQVKQATGGLELDTLNPVEAAPQRTIPGLFLHAIDDNLIPMSHTERNFEAYGGPTKDVSYFEGDHNSERPEDTNSNCITFLTTHLLAQSAEN